MERSLYFKGLMLLIRMDRMITDDEKRIMTRIGEILGFDKKFCEDTISELLDNTHIIDAPPQFSNPDVARSFINDGLRLTYSDGKIDEKGLAWLEAVAAVNGLDNGWYKTAVETASNRTPGDIEEDLEAKRLEWE
jgi:hypothetical protein